MLFLNYFFMDNKINKLCEVLNLTQEEFAEKLGVTQSSISQIKSKNKISSRMVATICAVFPQVNRGWLTTGKGDMFVADLDTTGSFVKEDRQKYSHLGGEIVNVIYAYYATMDKRYSIVTLYDSKTGKKVGRYSETDGGLVLF